MDLHVTAVNTVMKSEFCKGLGLYLHLCNPTRSKCSCLIADSSGLPPLNFSDYLLPLNIQRSYGPWYLLKVGNMKIICYILTKHLVFEVAQMFWTFFFCFIWKRVVVIFVRKHKKLFIFICYCIYLSLYLFVLTKKQHTIY
jgi:hypothetical protein